MATYNFLSLTKDYVYSLFLYRPTIIENLKLHKDLLINEVVIKHLFLFHYGFMKVKANILERIEN